MKIESKKTLKQIAALRDCILQFMSSHGREHLFNKQLDRLCPNGREKAVVELALVGDCLIAIEAVVFSLSGSSENQIEFLHRFLQTAAKLLARCNKKRYGEFIELKKADCERFLETHYTDRGLFGGANRRTQWSGFRLSKQLCQLSGLESPLDSYRDIFEGVVKPLLDEQESIESVLELGGVWTAITGGTEQRISASSHENNAKTELSNSVEAFKITDMNNPAILFDVVAGSSSAPVVKVNSRHNAFQNGHSFELLLQAWAHMEADAWDQRKQLLEDIRTDWGRAARDLSQDEDVLT